MGVVIPLEGAGSKKRASIEPLVKLTQADMDRVNEFDPVACPQPCRADPRNRQLI